MEPINAFLNFTVMSYFIASIFSIFNPVTINALKLGVMGKFIEKVLLLGLGFLLTTALFFDVQLLWQICAVVWTIDALATYLGYVEFNIIYQNKPSNVHQVVMFMWDTLIVLVCLIKI